MKEPKPSAPRLGSATRLAHAGRESSAHHGAVNVPLYRASTLLFPTLKAMRDRARAFTYGRKLTPTTKALAETIAELEGAEDYRHTVLAPSGLSAISCAILSVVKSGDHILVSDGVYNPTRLFCDEFLSRMGVETEYFDPAARAESLSAMFREKTALLFLESPSSLTFEMQDAGALAEVARRHRARTIMDNTWATPLFFRPLLHGADLSVQAATKYLSGHSDTLLGSVTATSAMRRALSRTHRQLGLCGPADEAYMTLRGLRTLSLRMARHQETGLALARFLESRAEISHVLHPALPSHRQHELWRRDFSGAAGLFGAVLNPVEEKALSAMFDGMHLFGMGYSWGGFESLLTVAEPDRALTGEAEGVLIRIHAGLEDASDLIEDLAAGLDRLSANSNG